MSSTTPSREEALEASKHLRNYTGMLGAVATRLHNKLDAFIESCAPDAAPAGEPAPDLTKLAQDCGATVYRNRANVHQPALAFGDESWARFCTALATPAGGAADERRVIQAARDALDEFKQQDDYLLANGASLMSDDSHEIIHVDTLARIVRAALASAPAAAHGMEKAGWKLVPIEPTPEMIAAVKFKPHPTRPNGWGDRAVQLWRMMISAAPSPKEGQATSERKGE